MVPQQDRPLAGGGRAPRRRPHPRHGRRGHAHGGHGLRHQHDVAWSGGPFVAPNATGNALDQPDCTAPQSCDDFTLHVARRPATAATHTLNVKVSWTNTAADFDVYVLDKAGNVVGTSASTADPEQVVLPPNAGDYTVRVVPYAPLGESYDATATLATTPANPAPGTDTPPGFTDYAAPSSLHGREQRR